MQYILLIGPCRADEGKSRSKEENERIFARVHGASPPRIKQSGHMRAGELLQGTSSAPTVRVKAGKTRA